MNRGNFKLMVMLVSLLLGAGPSLANDPVASQPGKSPPSKYRHAHAKYKLVNINAASKSELMKLPGIHAAEADRIIAGRPFGSKAWLVTKLIITEAVYDGLKDRVVAKQDKQTLDILLKRNNTVAAKAAPNSAPKK